MMAHLILAPGSASSSRRELAVLRDAIIMTVKSIARGVVSHIGMGVELHRGRHFAEQSYL